ncbi:hypothetical protein DFH06DRAFT_1317083 [Mycena polygramma]|nr:hypothetical protein DFH06DRAFT_1317083 [Mycena polygramma]
MRPPPAVTARESPVRPPHVMHEPARMRPPQPLQRANRPCARPPCAVHGPPRMRPPLPTSAASSAPAPSCSSARTARAPAPRYARTRPHAPAQSASSVNRPAASSANCPAASSAPAPAAAARFFAAPPGFWFNECCEGSSQCTPSVLPPARIFSRIFRPALAWALTRSACRQPPGLFSINM